MAHEIWGKAMGCRRLVFALPPPLASMEVELMYSIRLSESAKQTWEVILRQPSLGVRVAVVPSQGPVLPPCWIYWKIQSTLLLEMAVKQRDAKI